MLLDDLYYHQALMNKTHNNNDNKLMTPVNAVVAKDTSSSRGFDLAFAQKSCPLPDVRSVTSAFVGGIANLLLK